MNITKKLKNPVLLITFLSTLSIVSVAQSELTFRHTVTGDILDFSFGKKGEKTEALKHFMNTGENLYNTDKDVIKQGESLFLSACSGCHGHHAEGKLGPALGDDYYTYRKNSTDKGLFETIYGGARSMMGPQYNNLTKDEMLQIMAWIRSVYWGDKDKADWLTDEQYENFVPAEVPAEFAEALANFKKQNGE